MKRFWLNFFLGVLCTATASAATSSISRTIPTKSSGENIETEKAASGTTTINRATVSRNVLRTKGNEKNAVSRSVNTRKVGERATLSDGVNTVGRSARTEAASINNNGEDRIIVNVSIAVLELLCASAVSTPATSSTNDIICR